MSFACQQYSNWSQRIVCKYLELVSWIYWAWQAKVDIRMKAAFEKEIVKLLPSLSTAIIFRGHGHHQEYICKFCKKSKLMKPHYFCTADFDLMVTEEDTSIAGTILKKVALTWNSPAQDDVHHMQLKLRLMRQFKFLLQANAFMSFIISPTQMILLETETGKMTMMKGVALFVGENARR